MIMCETFPPCVENPLKCGYSINCSSFDEYENGLPTHFIGGIDCPYSKWKKHENVKEIGHTDEPIETTEMPEWYCKYQQEPIRKERDMLIVAKQSDVDDLYAIWNTVTARFIGVNLGKYEAVGLIMDYKECDFEKALSRVEHPQSFIDIAKQIVDELYNVCDIEHWLNREIERAKISMGEYAECFDGVKVDNDTRKELLKGHIRFCENGLKILKE